MPEEKEKLTSFAIDKERAVEVCLGLIFFPKRKIILKKLLFSSSSVRKSDKFATNLCFQVCQLLAKSDEHSHDLVEHLS